MIAPPGDEFHQRLKQLALKAQKHPPGSNQRNRALNQLVNEIWKSNLLGHPPRGQLRPSTYDDLYHEALQRTVLDIFHKIDNYNPENPVKGQPERPVMAWVNSMLKYNFIGVVNQFKNSRELSLPSMDFDEIAKLMDDNQKIPSLPSLDKLDEFLSVNYPMEDAQLLRYIEEDPENRLRTKHIKGRPDVNFQFLALARYDGRTWDDLSQELKISISTLNGFFQRSLQKFKADFDKYI